MKTIDVRQFVVEVLQSLPPPLSEHVIDDVFAAIESSPRWLAEYEGLCLKHTAAVVNSLGGHWVASELGKTGGKQLPCKRSTLIRSYSLLDSVYLPSIAKPNDVKARELMSQYYQANRKNLPSVSEMKIHRETIVELIQDGLSPGEAFNMVLANGGGTDA